MLFWRLHRASRIIFSLNYQLGNWTPKQAVDFLVERGGHERANAEAEVRRSAMVSPLYQAGYMIGALQFRSLYQELVESGRMSATEFHDAIMLGGRLPHRTGTRSANQSTTHPKLQGVSGVSTAYPKPNNVENAPKRACRRWLRHTSPPPTPRLGSARSPLKSSGPLIGGVTLD